MKTLIAYLQLVPAIIEAITAIEKAVPLPGQGKAKLDLVLALVRQLQAEVSEIPVEKLIATVTNIVGTVVGFLNAVGVFKTVAPR